MTADPRKVKKAFTLNALSYEEAMELSHFGAKVIYPPTIQPVYQRNIPIFIKNTGNPEFKGTIIHNDSEDEQIVKGISSISDIALLRVQGTGLIGVAGISGRLFSALADNHISVILITQASSEHSICFAVKPEQSEKAKKVLEQAFSFEIKSGNIDEIVVENGLSIVAVVGAAMNKTTGISGRLFNALGKNGINIVAIAQGSSELNISVVVEKKNEIKALNALHDAMFLSNLRTLHLYMIGTGLIGKTLIQQLQDQGPILKETNALDVQINALSNSRQMILSEEGINPSEAIEALEKEGTKANLKTLVDFAIEQNYPNSIVVDNTASEAPIIYYKEILANSISIVTPNKIAKTTRTAEHEVLLKTAAKSGARFLYETNVGAGLPIISTLKDLLQSGDEIIKIEAVLSGSLSFIFNNFSTDQKFSDVVKLAKEKGYTEPDPRDDLSGKDVARKALILSREIGQKIELEDIEIQNILPKPCIDAGSVDAFFKELEKQNDHFSSLIKSAEEEGKVLRFVSTITPDKVKVELIMADAENPFYALSGSDNMIVFTTKRYADRPLVIKGPGAGAEVTAAGVFAEIISIGNYLS